MKALWHGAPVLLAAAAMAWLPPPTGWAAHAADVGPSLGYPAAAHGPRRTIELGIGKSFVVTLPRDASEVLVADPQIANAIVRSADKAYLIGLKVGETDVLFFDSAGHQIEALAVNVGRDLTALREGLRTAIVDGHVKVSTVGDSITLSGWVHSPADAQTAVALATQAVGGDAKKVVNAIDIQQRQQVMLKVEVVEMDRKVEKQLGIQWNLQSMLGTTLLASGFNPGLGAAGVLQGVSGTSTIQQNLSGNGFGAGINSKHLFGYANLQALEQNSLARLLAAPTLTAITGESASFLAGGEFPYPSGLDQTGHPVLSYKSYGVTLDFTPVVLNDGRISMQIHSEVSQLDYANAVSIGGLAVPALTARRTNTTVEMPSGGSLAISGLLQNNVRHAIDGLPGLQNIPILGALFRSRDFQTDQTDLVVIVTPYLIKSVARDKLARPDKNFAPASDTQAILMGKLNRIYVSDRRPAPPAAYHGDYGFIIK